jgi:cyclopropane fatty-acyl-phospholipid synthase-like methyltransferase
VHGTQVRGVRDVGPDYAITLRAWRAAWEEKRAAVLQLGYSERFWRKYRCAILRSLRRCTRKFTR